MNRLKALTDLGQAVWLDYIRRDLLLDGSLARMVADDGVSGVTSNPAIFQKAIGESDLYDGDLADLLAAGEGARTTAVYESLAIKDIRMAADVLASVYRETGGADGFVSLEVSPHLARDTAGTIDEAARFWRLVDRPNLMIKVPATTEGIPAVEELLARGINVNITLMFSLAHYEAVARAYLRGAERCAHPEKLASVASFFVSRVDTLVDERLQEVGSEEALELQGTIGIANSKMAYQRYLEIFEGDDFARLAERGARPQRVLWASTSTKNPAYRDVIYVEELIGRNTVNTIPPATLEAFRDHGEVAATLTSEIEVARARLERLEELGIDLEKVTERLQSEGLSKFSKPFDRLLATLEEKRQKLAAVAAGSPSG